MTIILICVMCITMNTHNQTLIGEISPLNLNIMKFTAILLVLAGFSFLPFLTFGQVPPPPASNPDNGDDGEYTPPQIIIPDGNGGNNPPPADPTPTPTPTPVAPSGGGGGGGGPLYGYVPDINETLSIFNARANEISEGKILVIWETNVPAESKVVYDTASHVILSSSGNNFGYQWSFSTDNSTSTSHSVLISGFNPDTNYYLRPVSSGHQKETAGNEFLIKTETVNYWKTVEPPVKTVAPLVLQTPADNIITDKAPLLTANIPACAYLSDAMSLEKKNNPVEVIKLKLFLNEKEGAYLFENGVYDQKTFDAVSAFQEKYKNDILTPFQISETNGAVGILTLHKINELACGKKIALSAEELSFINKNLLGRNLSGVKNTRVVGTQMPIIPLVKNDATNADSATTNSIATVTPREEMVSEFAKNINRNWKFMASAIRGLPESVLNYFKSVLNEWK